MKKFIILFLVVGLAILAVAGYLFFSSIDSLVESAIERVGSNLTGTTVTVGSVQLSLSTGEGVIKDVRISNPASFPRGEAFTLDQIQIGIDKASLGNSPVILDQVAIIGPMANVQRNSSGEVNLDTILKNLKSHKGSDGDSESGGTDEEESLKLRIDDFVFQEGLVRVSDAASGQEAEVKLPQLQMRNVGGQRGSTPEDVGREVLSEFGEEVAKVLARIGLERAIDSKLKGNAGEAAKKLLEKVF